MRKTTVRHHAGFRRSALALASAALFGVTGAAHAFQIDAGPDWKVNFDNTVLYNLGARMQNVDSRIGNNPFALAESDHRFPNSGDIVTNRLSLLSEFDAVYQKRLGMRLSAALWKDAAYDDKPRGNPGTMMDASIFGLGKIPYPTNYANGEYSSYTKRYQVEGGELLDAFVFANFDLNERPSSLKIGKMTQFWGNALFFGGAGVSYLQAASDVVKQMTAPGTQAKELAMPRGQINFSTQLNDSLQFGAQYFLQYQEDRMPSGGTYLGMADFLFEGPTQAGMLGLLAGFPGPAKTVARLESARPSDINDNFGLQLKWSPEWLNGIMGFYYRQFDETASWDPIMGGPPNVTALGTLPGSYRLSYPDQVKMLAMSLDRQIGGASVGLEISYRQNTGLNTNGGVVSATDPDNSRGARGDTLNIIANALSILDRSSWYNTGTLLGEVAVVHKLKVTDQEGRYKGVDTAACTAFATQDGVATTGSVYTGCSTDTAVTIAGFFEPQWLQALPGWDLSMPMFGMYGLYGSAASNGMPVKQGDLMYGIGFKGVLNSRYNFTLQYNGYNGHAPEVTSLNNLTTLLPPGQPQFYSSAGNSMYRYNDRNWLSFTFSTTF